MNEDSVKMEKKNFIPPSKKLDSSRSRQDGSSHVDKLRSKPTHHYDGSTGPTGQKTEAGFRGSGSSKGKVFEKRARSRESNTQPAHPPRGPEVGSLQAPGGKKQSAHNLLQFVLAPRDRIHQFGHPYFGGDLRYASHGYHRSKHNKDQYLNGRCQLMVIEGHDYSSYDTDPDRLVDWKLVQQVFVRAVDDHPQCPICLEIPKAAKITKCGHIYCSACLLHYFALSDGTYKSCPICYESIQVSEGKSVLAKICKDAKVGEPLEMKLMYREKNSMTLKQVLDGEKFDSLDSKIIVISNEEVYGIIERELMELRKQYAEEVQNPEVCFVEEAIRNAVARQINCCPSVAQNNDPSTTKNISPMEPQGGGESGTCSGQKSCGGNAYAHGKASEVDHAIHKLSLEVKVSDRERKESEGSGNGDKLDAEEFGYYFYQATDGQNIFLHPINVAMLKKEFGYDSTNWPAFVNCAVLEIEDGNITEEKRKRHKFLSHLALASAVKIVEVDISGLVSEDVRKEFSGQLEYREKRRMEKEMNEKLREKMYEEQEKKKKWRAPKPKIESQVDFPSCSIFRPENESTLFEAMRAHAHAEKSMADPFPSTSMPGLTSTSMPGLMLSYAAPLTPESPTRSAFSFAQAARRPGVKGSLIAPKLHPDFNKTSMLSSPQTPEKGDDEYAAPEYSSVISQEMAKAFACLELDQREKSCEEDADGSKKKGRKKGKGKILFATGFGGFGNK